MKGGRNPAFLKKTGQKSNRNNQKTGQNIKNIIAKTGQNELDFLIEKGGKVVPIEVKSGKGYKSHKSLDNYMATIDYHLEKAYVFSVFNVETEGKIIYLPIYMSYLLKESPIDQLIVDLDISGL